MGVIHFSSKLVILFTVICGSISSFAQEKVKIKDVRKNCAPDLYELDIRLCHQYLNQDPTNFEVHYILSKSYSGRANEFAELQIAYNREHSSMIWGAVNYEEVLELYRKMLNCSDSSLFYYGKCSTLVDEGFLSKNKNSCEMAIGICYAEFSKNPTLSGAQQFLTSQIKSVQGVIDANKKSRDKLLDELNSYKKQEEILAKKAYDLAHPIVETKGAFTEKTINLYTNKTYTSDKARESYIALTLKSNKTYSAEWGVQDWACAGQGTFKIQDGNIHLTANPKECQSASFGYTLGNCKIELLLNDTSIYNTQFIKVTPSTIKFENEENKSSSFILPVLGMEVKKGESRRWETEPIVILGMQRGTIKTSAKCSVSPSSVSPVRNAYVMSSEDDPYSMDEVETINSKTPITLIAHTVKKELVGTIEDHWYLVNIDNLQNNYENHNQELWIHGQFIKIGE